MKKIVSAIITFLIVIFNISYADHIYINPLVKILYKGSIFTKPVFAGIFTTIIVVVMIFILYKICNIKNKPENKKWFISMTIFLLFITISLVIFSFENPLPDKVYIGGIGEYLVYGEDTVKEDTIWDY